MIACFSDLLLTNALMLPGGEISDGEMPEVAAARFLKDVGVTASLPDIRIMGVIQHVGELVHVCHCPTRDIVHGDGAAWFPLSDVMRRGSTVPHSTQLASALCRAGL